MQFQALLSIPAMIPVDIQRQYIIVALRSVLVKFYYYYPSQILYLYSHPFANAKNIRPRNVVLLITWVIFIEFSVENTYYLWQLVRQ